MFVFVFGLSCYPLRNKMVEYLTDWVMGTSNQAADDDIKCLTRYFLLITLNLSAPLSVQPMDNG